MHRYAHQPYVYCTEKRPSELKLVIKRDKLESQYGWQRLGRTRHMYIEAISNALFVNSVAQAQETPTS